MKKPALFLILGLYLASSVISFGLFSYFGSGNSLATTTQDQQGENEETLLSELLEIDPKEEKDQVCPLNGKYYTQTEREAWEKRRPLAVMIENHPEARPQSGLSEADVVFEAIAEGGVTRFMGMFYCEVQRFDTTLAPIRSARSYFVDWASGFNRPLYVHVGGANLPGPADALGQISDYGWAGENDLNQFSIGYPTFVRDYNRVEGKEVATEHTMVTTTEGLWEVGVEREWTNISRERKAGYKTVGGDDWQEDFESWSFQDSQPEAGQTRNISYDFWSGYGDYSVKWEFDAETNGYKRFMGGDSHVDLNNDQQIQAANVIVLLTTEKGPIDEKKHLLYGTTGTGDALLFKNGEAVEVTWSKKTRTSELDFIDNRGKQVPLARGLTWISVVSKDTEVAY
ncbi:MAG: DUF3048 domain-containing protein [Candidatus Pacebacteria bacterium]|nr:DUF3048 domain-containing protein [Candidatus Paceibacterota bacterium]MBT3511642.1 DUF3048 domain-containing protein [Candidatus Paceibacterota bacterium]MBT4004595.1 DUF3048 domain-containing protein [Candidatus Paceibacterota bacterium]MBT4359158.1 DUF3048 domain-containing protein [Candidatus Paceibacterota bacterium]MBT4681248.1 DUF3048 domain-containing protein [Candidatus Paceibacterota bacterium]